MLHEKLHLYQIILASKSPRREQLLKGLDIPFIIKVKEVSEEFPPHLKKEEIALFLAELKAAAYDEELDEKTLVITADTIVWINNTVLNKPKDYADAVTILTQLSGNMHEVITGVCLKTKNKTKSFYAITKVYFKTLTPQEFDYYIT